MIALITDLHFGFKNCSDKIFESQMMFFEEQFFPYLIEHDIKEVICAGDITHDRVSIDWKILNALKERFFSFFDNNGITFHLLIGNHDLLEKDSLDHHSANTLFHGYSKLFYYNKITTIQIESYLVGFIPWQTDRTLVLPKADILFLHADIIGAKMNSKKDSTKGFDPSIFKYYTKVFSGHYHSISKIGNVQYLGSPYQYDWGDCGEQRGFWILKDNYELEFIENKVSPKFVKLIYSEDEIELVGI